MSGNCKTKLVLLAVFVLLAGCGADSDSKDSDHVNKSGIDLSAEVDELHSSVTLPSDRLMLSDKERDILLSAQSGAMAQCARENGLAWTGWNISLGDYSYSNMWREFGPWTEEMASTFAFAQPRSTEGLMTAGLIPMSDDFVPPDVPNTNLTDEEIELVTQTCGNDPTVRSFREQDIVTNGPWDDTLGGTFEIVMGDPEAEQVFDELAKCFVDNGMSMNEEAPGFPTAANVDVIDEEQIDLALRVVSFHESVGSIERLVDIMAGIQAPVIEEYADELADQRKTIDQKVEKAEQFIADNPELYEDPA